MPTTDLLKLVEYQRDDRVARIEWLDVIDGWLLILSGPLKGGRWRQRREFPPDQLTSARQVARWWVRDGIVVEVPADDKHTAVTKRRRARAELGPRG